MKKQAYSTQPVRLTYTVQSLIEKNQLVEKKSAITEAKAE